MFVVIHICQLSDLVFSRAAALPPVLADVSENIIDEERKLEDDFAKEARLEFCRICFSISIDSRYLGSVVSPVVAALAGAGRVARADGLQGRVLAQRGVQRLRVRPEHGDISVIIIMNVIIISHVTAAPGAGS